MVPPAKTLLRATVHAVGLSCLYLVTGGVVSPGVAAARPPNIVVIETDDQSMHSFRRDVMPQTFRTIVDQGGTKFRNGIAAPPLCCPSRAGFLTGQYPHNHGVFDNEPGYADLRRPRNTLPIWLRDAGYQTAFVGKYLNGTKEALGADPAPGWDKWYAIQGRPAYYHPDINVNGQVRDLRDRYVTTVLNDYAQRTIERFARDDRPFFLWLAHLAPHASRGTIAGCDETTPKPLKQDRRTFRNYPFERRPSFNEADVSDKPQPIRNLDELPRREIRRIKLRYRCTLGALQEVDRGVKGIWHTLGDERLRRNTIVAFTSDNGYFFGEHRINMGKGRAYEEALNIPYVINTTRRVLGGPAVSRVDEVAANIDLAPTLLDAASAAPCHRGRCTIMDGRSLNGLLAGSGGSYPADRGVLIEVGDASCRFAAIRAPRKTFSVNLRRSASTGLCESSERELYDLDEDPFELENIASTSPRVPELEARLESLRRCSGIAGRDPAPKPPGSYCE